MPELLIDPSLTPCPTIPALIWAEGISPPILDPGLPKFLIELQKRVQQSGENFWKPGLKDRVRKMLRFGHYKPSGRSKPASEYLLAAALANSFPSIHAPVNVNNAISLESGYPGSIFDSAKSGDCLLLRRGLLGENYVFNTSGQSIDLEDLLLVCRRHQGQWQPCGNPVKDAMTTKITETTGSLIAILYAPADEPLDLVDYFAKRYKELLIEQCQATEAKYCIIDK